ncbi:MAG: NADH-quinone oxidoreductase subunit C [Candidatus Poseidoniaceae archaeon]|jgi:NADH-quinone oxidoreductase subunit C|nr:NADH-quinone oxidoreductase subunit C [Candidatus Poseidoniaceae archaeon]MDP7203659.1 NADH-quinone oxidoreductase subunit C [Candidatus Poseidoniaceae archaeon]|tara:strand:- start:246 stop:899 length:654 start_codon:yes stop_codon:yes gene_type:complete
MGMAITSAQNKAAVDAAVAAVMDRFGGTGIEATSVEHSTGKHASFLRIISPPRQWLGLAKFLRFDLGVNHCSMVTGTHFPDGAEERGWEVAYHFMRMPVKNQASGACVEHDAATLTGLEIPLEVEIFIPLAKGDSPVVDSIQSIWVGADWNEKETWDLVGIEFKGHKDMMRVLNPHDSPLGFHPLQKQHKLRYHDYNEMYDDAQGFERKPTDSGLVK